MGAELAQEQGRGDSVAETFCLEIREGCAGGEGQAAKESSKDGTSCFP